MSCSIINNTSHLSYLNSNGINYQNTMKILKFPCTVNAAKVLMTLPTCSAVADETTTRSLPPCNDQVSLILIVANYNNTVYITVRGLLIMSYLYCKYNIYSIFNIQHIQNREINIISFMKLIP